MAIGRLGLRQHRVPERVEAQVHMNPNPIRETRSERVLASRCGQCGETFEPTRPHQRFCRPSCRRATVAAGGGPVCRRPTRTSCFARRSNESLVSRFGLSEPSEEFVCVEVGNGTLEVARHPKLIMRRERAQHRGESVQRRPNRRILIGSRGPDAPRAPSIGPGVRCACGAISRCRRSPV